MNAEGINLTRIIGRVFTQLLQQVIHHGVWLTVVGHV